MNTLIVGGGGREHAFSLGFEDSGVSQFFTNPNVGMERLGTNLNVRDVEDITDIARDINISLVVIGPEAPLLSGLADSLRAEKIAVLGLGVSGAQLEGSKSFAVEFMNEYGVPHPKSQTVSDWAGAMRYVSRHNAENYVIKANGQAGGHGVILPDSYSEAKKTVRSMLSGELFGTEGETIVFQERLTGPEVSLIALYDGKHARVLYTVQDHKRLLDGDEGPNTGGMGAYSPLPVELVTKKQQQEMLDALDKTMSGMEHRGINSPGFLYLGFMLAREYDDQPVVIEYNVRSGDPETQVIIPRMQAADIDVHELFDRAAHGRLKGDRISMLPDVGRAALTVCLAAEGYPESPRTKDVMHGFSERSHPDVIFHHGGTRRGKGGRVLTSGGRVLYVTGLGESVVEARDKAYDAIDSDSGGWFRGMHYRQDIGYQAMKALKSK